MPKQTPDDYLKGLEDKAKTWEQKADYAKKAKELTDRIDQARKTYDANQPPSPFAWLSKFIPRGPGKVMIGLVVLVVIILLLAKAC